VNRYGGLYLATAVALVPIDILFLGVFAKGFFASQVRDIMGGGQAGADGPVLSAFSPADGQWRPGKRRCLRRGVRIILLRNV
jgi:hypothetical protein